MFDWYLELAKAPLRTGEADTVRQTLGVVMRDLLAYLHPVMPYLTEELWSHLVGEGFLTAASWPSPASFAAPDHFEVFQDLVVGIRRFRAEHGLSPRHPLEVFLVDPGGVVGEWWDDQFQALASTSPTVVDEAPEGEHSPIVAGQVHAYISLEGVVDTAAERERLDKEIDETRVLLARSRGKLDNDEFVSKAPEAIVAKERDRVDELEATLAELDLRRAALG